MLQLVQPTSKFAIRGDVKKGRRKREKTSVEKVRTRLGKRQQEDEKKYQCEIDGEQHPPEEEADVQKVCVLRFEPL